MPDLAFFNPFKSDKQYYKRTYDQCIDQFLDMMFGDPYNNVGLMDYFLILPVFLKWMASSYCSDDVEMTITIILSALEGIVMMPVLAISIPFVYIYNSIGLLIGRSTRKAIENLDLLVFNPLTQIYLAHLDTPQEKITFDFMASLVGHPKALVLFENDDIYYFDSATAQLKKLEPNQNNLSLHLSVLRDIMKNMPLNSGRLFLKGGQSSPIIEQLIEWVSMDYERISSTIKNADSFIEIYYGENNDKERIKWKDLNADMTTYSLRSAYVHHNEPNKDSAQARRFILRIGRNYEDRPEYFIVPSKANARAIKTLIETVNFSNFGNHSFARANTLAYHSLQHALEEKDPFPAAFELKKAIRVCTPVFLLNALRAPAQGAMLKLYDIIADYADCRPTESERKETNKILNNTLWANPPKAIPEELTPGCKL